MTAVRIPFFEKVIDSTLNHIFLTKWCCGTSWRYQVYQISLIYQIPRLILCSFVNQFLYLLSFGSSIRNYFYCFSLLYGSFPLLFIIIIRIFFHWSFIASSSPTGNYMFKVNNINTRARFEICSNNKGTRTTPASS